MIHWPAITAVATCSTRCCPRCDTLPGEKRSPPGLEVSSLAIPSPADLLLPLVLARAAAGRICPSCPGRRRTPRMARMRKPSSPGPGAYNTTSLTGRMNLGLGCILFETVFLCSFVLSSLSMDKIAMYCNWTSAYVIAYFFQILKGVVFQNLSKISNLPTLSIPPSSQTLLCFDPGGIPWQCPSRVHGQIGIAQIAICGTRRIRRRKRRKMRRWRLWDLALQWPASDPRDSADDCSWLVANCREVWLRNHLWKIWDVNLGFMYATVLHYTYIPKVFL